MNDLGINFELNFELESLDEDSPTPSPSNRFKELSSQEIDKIAEGKNEKATLYNTTWGVKLFKEWCTAKGKDSNFEVLLHEELNCLLRVFYAEVRNKDGKMYAKQSFVGLRAAIHRHLTGEPFCRQINVISDREFQGANNVFRGVLKQMKKVGLDRSQHKSSIAAADLKKMITALDVETPQGLLRLTWFYLEYYFCRRGREGLRLLKKDSFKFCKDDGAGNFVP
ncbi:uncharacterized protein [Apostichopus japonicus]|uniref:uncharacterized protein n=1 Tax=Stichopus japonicus TaxID=307972 RepID=UPI003AB88BAD